MKILHVDTGREYRGGQRQALLLMTKLRTAGHECELAARPGELWEQAAGAGFRVFPANLFAVWRHSAQFDLVHAHDARAHSVAALCARVPFVVSRRVAFPVSQSVASRWKYTRAARYLAVSRFVAEQLQSAHVPARKVDVVYDAIEACASPTDWNPQGPVVALASSDPKKGRDLIERASRIADVPIKFSSDLSHDLLQASLFLYISRSEGFGSAALLAMSIGVPVIGSRIGGLMEAFEDGVSGVAVENEPTAIAVALKRVLEETALAERLIENARRRVKSRFTADILLAGTLASYELALGRGRNFGL